MPDSQTNPPLAGLEIHPVTLDRWADMEELFETSTFMSSCWCMSQRTRASEFSRFGSEARKQNRENMHGMITAGTVPGLLAYVGGQPVGWISAGPRAEFARLRHSTALRPVDDRPVWAIVCLFTRREYRRQGVTRALIQAAVQYAADHGAAAVEAYPVTGWGKKFGPGDAYTGMASTYRALGFQEVGSGGSSRGQPRLIMRYPIQNP